MWSQRTDSSEPDCVDRSSFTVQSACRVLWESIYSSALFFHSLIRQDNRNSLFYCPISTWSLIGSWRLYRTTVDPKTSRWVFLFISLPKNGDRARMRASLLSSISKSGRSGLKELKLGQTEAQVFFIESEIENWFDRDPKWLLWHHMRSVETSLIHTCQDKQNSNYFRLS